jgi:2-polyprenylphenol 6-hydroxylase
MQKIDFDVIVVGGGLVGSAFALDLATQNPKLNIAILEKSKPKDLDLSRLDNRIYAISPNNIKYLKNLQAWSENEDRVGIIKTMDVSGETGGNIILQDKVIYADCLAKTIESNYLQHQIYTKLTELLNITFIYDNLENIEVNDDYAKLFCTNSIYTTSLIIGSDGANSFVREKSGIPFGKISYEQSGVVANFKCEKPHNNVAYQWFRGDNILAYLPLPYNQISIVWANPDSKSLLNMTEAEFCESVARASGYKLGKLELVTEPAAFPLRLYLIDQFYTERIVLVGDAAHTVHPLAGQGVNLGFGDARELAKILTKVEDYQLGDTSLLAKYNAQRISEVRQMQLVCHSLHNLFNMNQPLISKLRNTGLNIVNSIPLLKKYLISSASQY